MSVRILHLPPAASAASAVVGGAVLAGLLAAEPTPAPGLWLWCGPLAAGSVGYFAVGWRRGRLLAVDGLFLIAQLVMVFGTVRLADPTSAVDTQYAQAMIGAVLVYVVVGFVANTRPSSLPINPSIFVAQRVPPSPAFVGAVTVSLAVTLAYFHAVGYSAFLSGLHGRLTGDTVDIVALRLQSYAGSRYLFPGYVNQFKNAILPALSLVFATWAFGRRSLLVRAGSWLLVGLSVLGLLWTGQRGAFVAFLLTAGLYLYLHGGRRLSRRMLLLPAVGVPLTLLATSLLGRGTTANGALLDRFLHDNQASGLAAFRYTNPRPMQHGSEWLQALAGILPGNRGSTLSSEVFATIYGSTRGTSPPSLWGSVAYNFGPVGVALAATILGLALPLLASRLSRCEARNSLQLVGMAGVTVTVGTWIADGPVTLLNTGLLAYAGLWWWGCRITAGQHPVMCQASATVPSSSPHRT